MKTTNERFINIQLFAEPEGASTPNTNTQDIDYESEYRKMVAERDSYKAEAEKQKGLKDKYASENADYKKKELDKMTDDEKKAKEYQELVENNKKLESRLREIETQNSLIGEGFTKEESAELIKANFSINDISVLSKIIKSKIEEAVKSAKAEGIKDSTPSSPMGNGTAKGADKSDFQMYQESKKQSTNMIEI